MSGVRKVNLLPAGQMVCLALLLILGCGANGPQQIDNKTAAKNQQEQSLGPLEQRVSRKPADSFTPHRYPKKGT